MSEVLKKSSKGGVQHYMTKKNQKILLILLILSLFLPGLKAQAWTESFSEDDFGEKKAVLATFWVEGTGATDDEDAFARATDEEAEYIPLTFMLALGCSNSYFSVFIRAWSDSGLSVLGFGEGEDPYLRVKFGENGPVRTWPTTTDGGTILVENATNFVKLLQKTANLQVRLVGSYGREHTIEFDTSSLTKQRSVISKAGCGDVFELTKPAPVDITKESWNKREKTFTYNYSRIKSISEYQLVISFIKNNSLSPKSTKNFTSPQLLMDIEDNSGKVAISLDQTCAAVRDSKPRKNVRYFSIGVRAKNDVGLGSAGSFYYYLTKDWCS